MTRDHGFGIMPGKNDMRNNKRTRQAVKERVEQASMGDFFAVIGFGAGIGLIMGYFDSFIPYMVCLTIATTSMLTSFMIFIIPKIIAALKKPEIPISLGEYLARGKDKENDIPRLNIRTRIKIITPDF